MDSQIDSSTDALDSVPGSEHPAQHGRLTPARQTVVRILKATQRALTHHEIEQQARGEGIQFDRVTLYRALEWLVSNDYAHKVAAEDRIWRFSAARGNAREQAYFHCTTCGSVYCLDVVPGQVAAALPEGFKARRSELMIQGECQQAACKA